jgi:DNA processing protein
LDAHVIYTLLHDCWGDGANEILRLCMQRFDADAFMQQEASALYDQAPEISLDKWNAWCSFRSSSRYDNRCQELDRLGVGILLNSDADYPQSLSHVYRPPAILYIRGNLNLSGLNIGMVGSRRATAYGKNVAYSMAKALAAENVCIISGLAKGIDVNAHKGALDGGGRTIAVLGCGIDRVYPRENEPVYQAIAETPGCAIISEWPIGAGALAYHFPQRNRIIAGMSDGVVVVEAAAKSGSLITASLALEGGKDVFAVPGMITSANSVGCHRLIKDGAKLVSRPEDILEEYGQLSLFSNKIEAQPTYNLSEDAAGLLKHLTGVPQSIDDLCAASGMDVSAINSALIELTLEDLVVEHEGRQYSKNETK